MENTFLVFEWAQGYGCSLGKARKLRESEKKYYRQEIWDTAFVGLDDKIKLDEVTWKDNPDRPVDGSPLGYRSRLWIISEEEYRAYLELNEDRVQQKKEEKRAERIEFLRERIKDLEKLEPLPTQEEVRERERQYSLANNEAGYGYIPRFYSQENLERYRGELKALENGEL